jgi:acetyl-CoA C-acetyltransferase
MEEVVVIDAVRTPIGSFGGMLRSITAPDLGAVVIGALFKNNSLNPDLIEEAVMGNALSAGVGQSPARQAVLRAGLKNTTPTCTINKAGASGMKAVMYAMQQIQTGDAQIMVAGGMESMSNVPHYVSDARFGIHLGHGKLQDGILRDGMWDVFKNYYMGNAAELCASTHKITREQQDEYAAESHRRVAKAHDQGAFEAEIATVKVRNRKGRADVVGRDEETGRSDSEALRKLPPTFEKEGTVTAGNSSSLNDGAAALLLMSESKARELGYQPIARLVSQASAAQAPEWFSTTPAKAIKRALERAGKTVQDMDLFEINEDFAIVGLVNTDLLDADPARVNVHGGAIGMGHPLGCSGARILVTLIHALRRHDKNWGCAGICSGGGGASAMVVERLS